MPVPVPVVYICPYPCQWSSTPPPCQWSSTPPPCQWSSVPAFVVVQCTRFCGGPVYPLLGLGPLCGGRLPHTPSTPSEFDENGIKIGFFDGFDGPGQMFGSPPLESGENTRFWSKMSQNRVFSPLLQARTTSHRARAGFSGRFVSFDVKNPFFRQNRSKGPENTLETGPECPKLRENAL